IEVVTLRGQPARDLRPALGGCASMVGFIARLTRPGPARTHFVPFDGPTDPVLVVQLAELTECCLFAYLPLGALDKLKHRDVESNIPRPQGHSECCRRLALAVTGVYGQYGRVAPRPGGQPIIGELQRTALWHKRLPFSGDAAHGPRQKIG